MDKIYLLFAVLFATYSIIFGYVLFNYVDGNIWGYFAMIPLTALAMFLTFDAGKRVRKKS